MNKLFGNAFLLARMQSRLKQIEVAKRAEVDPSYVAAIERGRRRPPSRETLDRLIAALSITEQEKRKLRSLAAIDRILEAADAADELDEPVVRLVRLLDQIACLEVADWSTVEWVVRGMTRRRQEITGASA